MQILGVPALNEEVERFASTLRKGKEATVIALSGGLGAGKTAFTQALARHFGVTESVSSPTFVIEKIYELPKGEFKRLIHIDAHRITKAKELENLGWKNIVADPENLIAIEWPEHAKELIPEKAHRISLKYIDEYARDITYA